MFINRLLINEGGKYIDKTSSFSSDLLKTGLVTGALFSDVNQDSWIDLLIVHELGTVTYFQNNKGVSFTDVSEKHGLKERSGWYNSISGNDIDLDGDIDYVVTNFGLNTKYHASKKHPYQIYYGDLDNSGKSHIIETEYEGDKHFPIRGKSCSSNAMPSLLDKFETFHKYAVSEVDEIYQADLLALADVFTVNNLESGVLINHGEGKKFEWRPLPRLAQISPSFGLSVNDLNGDSYPDILLAQNFFHSEPETGKMSGGLGMLLYGSKEGTFTPVWPKESGVIIPEDATRLIVHDVNLDMYPDFIVGINNGPARWFINKKKEGKFLGFELSSTTQNHRSIGAKVSVFFKDKSKISQEIYSGSSYLSQSGKTLWFGISQKTPIYAEVIWPNGSLTKHPLNSNINRIIKLNIAIKDKVKDSTL